MSAGVTSPELLAQASKDLCRRDRPRTLQPVHRLSRHEGERERRAWRQHNTFATDEHNARMRALEHLEETTREPGKRNGVVGAIGIELYRRLLRLRERGSGRLEPSYAWLAAWMNRSRSAIARSIARLKALGFLDWFRRTRPVEGGEPGGQYVEQISNAYLLELRGEAAEIVRRILRKPSEKLRAILLERDRERRHKETARKTSDEVLATVSDPELRRLLTSLRDGIERASPPEPMRTTLRDLK